MICEDQSETIDFLRAAARAASGEAPEIVTTHISTVLLFADTAWKLKRAVRLPYVDFSTPERRAAACETEFALNRRAAPRLYRGARQIRRAADGLLGLDGDGALVDALVEMRRFAARDLMETVVREGRLDRATLETLAAHIAAFHAAEPPDRQGGGAAGLARAQAINAQGLRASPLFEAEAREALIAACEAARGAQASLLEARRAAGRVRHCHGDLTLANICLLDGEPTMFDRLDFDAALATTDVLYDIAFTLMDLTRLGRRDLSNELFNRYLDHADEADGLALMPLFMATRAAVRAHVEATRAGEATDPAASAAGRAARGYFDLARALFAPATPMLVAVGGFSGSGKSTLARGLAADVGPAPGARHLASDRLRKAMFGVAATTTLPAEAYAPEASARVYERLYEEAARALAAGGAVVADAVFDRADARAAIEAVACAAGVRFLGLWLDAPDEALRARVAARRGDPSDAGVEVVAAQTARGAGEIAWLRIDARDQAAALSAARGALAATGAASGV
ncbi:MAG: AAA family ATPase [Rhizobiales bacterium]|nr:AAA family ATPase [Hyphomicrobiales bacterium]